MKVPALTLSITETLLFLGMVALVWVMLDILGGQFCDDDER
jgi:hypothetical protein